MPFNYAKSKTYLLLDQIKEMSNSGHGSRSIAKKLGINRSTVIRACRKMGVETVDKKNPRKPIPEEKECIDCHSIKKIEEFRRREKGDRVSYEAECLICEQKRNKISCKQRYNNNKQKRQEYRIVNKDKINNTRKERMHNDPGFRLRCNISCNINRHLIKKGLTKEGKSCIKFLLYTVDELKKHIESQFEPWMNWDNFGKYELKTWNDNDQSTWRWNIDHIIPASKFNYTSVEDEEFKQCWALSNLRPLSAKVNLIEGDRR